MHLAAVLSLLVCGGLLAPAALQQASAQELAFPPAPPKPPKSKIAIDREKSGDKQMLVQAREINYDYNNHKVSAVGGVQIYYGGSTIEADRVIYDQTSKRLRAEGNVRLTEDSGNVTYGDVMDLTDDYRNGFVDSLRLETPDETRMAATSADRSNGNYTVFHDGVYTACKPCVDNPKKPPLWQVKAARIIHDQTEKMIYFEDAKLEFFGQPLAWLPYFSAPDPTVKRKTGFLIPTPGSSTIFGQSLEIPYYWALAPNYDVTFSPVITTRQGPLLQGEFRQRTETGQFDIRAAGIKQLDKDYFKPAPGVDAPGYRDFRGSLETSGQFAINKNWLWGFDGVVLSDKQFLRDYNPRLSAYRFTDPFAAVANSANSQLYITGQGNRSFFDARAIYYLGFSPADIQSQIPVVAPVIDYNYIFDHPIAGGQLGYNINFTSLSRQQANFDAISRLAQTTGQCALSADSAQRTSADCVLRGVPGTYSRFSAETEWKRSITDSYGQIFTPFAKLRVDASSSQVNNDPGVSNFINTGDNNLVRAMPTIGLEYRYPFISTHSWGTQTIEPIAQIIARPNETQVNRWQNEDAQTLVFDDSNLFRVDKFSGYDRVEGGGRANYGAQYTAQFNQGGFVNVLFGQSYQLFGENSFAQASTTNTGLNSGLDTRASDYVARASYAPNNTYKLTSRFRFDKDDFTLQRAEYEVAANFNRWSTSLLYGDYAAQPLLGYNDRRQGLLGTGSVKLDANWLLRASALYDVRENKFTSNMIGIGYIDDCLILALNYITNYSYGTGTAVLNHTVMLQLSLRTLGGTTVSQGISSSGSSN
ncbi:MAG TPA: LPS-assembly protein LptD [Pseudolabrys sp.]